LAAGLAQALAAAGNVKFHDDSLMSKDKIKGIFALCVCIFFSVSFYLGNEKCVNGSDYIRTAFWYWLCRVGGPILPAILFLVMAIFILYHLVRDNEI